MSESNYNRVVKTFLLVIAAAIILYVLYLLIDIIIIIAISILLSFIFAPFVALLEARGMNRLPATIIVFAIFGFLLYLGLSVFIPKLVYQMDQLTSALKGFSIDEEMKAFESGIIKYIPFLQPGDVTEKVESFISNQVFYQAG